MTSETVQVGTLTLTQYGEAYYVQVMQVASLATCSLTRHPMFNFLSYTAAAADGQAATAVTAPLAPQDPANGAAELPRVLAQPPGPMELHRGFEAILPGQANAAAASAGLSSLFAHFRAAAIPNAAGVLPPASAAIQNTLPFFSGINMSISDA